MLLIVKNAFPPLNDYVVLYVFRWMDKQRANMLIASYFLFGDGRHRMSSSSTNADSLLAAINLQLEDLNKFHLKRIDGLADDSKKIMERMNRNVKTASEAIDHMISLQGEMLINCDMLAHITSGIPNVINKLEQQQEEVFDQIHTIGDDIVVVLNELSDVVENYGKHLFKRSKTVFSQLGRRGDERFQ